MAKPQPVPKDLICSECGLDWNLHPKNPRRRDCIELLKARIYPLVTYPYVTWNNPVRYDHYPNWWGTITTTDTITGGTAISSDTVVINTN